MRPRSPRRSHRVSEGLCGLPPESALELQRLPRQIVSTGSPDARASLRSQGSHAEGGKSATPRRGEGGPQANLVNLFVTAWRGQGLTKNFNKISGPAGGGKSATSTCILDPADSDGSEIKSMWYRGAVLPPESVAGVQRNTPAGAQAPRLYEATRRNSPPTDQSMDYSSCRLCQK